MRRHMVVTAFAALLLAGAGLLLLTRTRGGEEQLVTPVTSKDAASVTATTATMVPPPPAAQVAVATTPGIEPALLQTPQAQVWLQREAFEQQAHAFFATAAQMPTAQREREAAALENAIATYEAAHQLSAGEAMNLRLGLLQASIADEVERGARQAELIARYQRDGAQREARWEQQLAGDVRFQDYKRREQLVVAEVLALPQIPGGLTRDEYLRQRLQAERVMNSKDD